MIGSQLKAEVIRIEDTTEQKFLTADLIGFGSGVYFGQLDRRLFDLLRKFPPQNRKKAFVFYTSGLMKLPLVNPTTSLFAKLLKEKGYRIIGTFGCRGWDTYPKLVRPWGGIQKMHPNSKDFERARLFVSKLKTNLDRRRKI